jgi:hypothetical protein
MRAIVPARASTIEPLRRRRVGRDWTGTEPGPPQDDNISAYAQTAPPWSSTFIRSIAWLRLHRVSQRQERRLAGRIEHVTGGDRTDFVAQHVLHPTTLSL